MGELLPLYQLVYRVKKIVEINSKKLKKKINNYTDYLIFIFANLYKKNYSLWIDE